MGHRLHGFDLEDSTTAQNSRSRANRDRKEPDPESSQAYQLHPEDRQGVCFAGRYLVYRGYRDETALAEPG
jgi:hypothetical protein